MLLAGLAAFSACGGDRDGPPASSAVVATLRPESTEATGARDWNVLLITLDTVRADALGAYGQARGATPNLDRIAAEGIVFDAAVSSSPNTLPAHASIFTGKHPYAHGVRSNFAYELPSEQETLAERLADAGYRTGAEVAATVMRGETQIAQGFENTRDPSASGVELKTIRRASDGESVGYPIRVARDIAGRGSEFIRANRDRRFFLWLHFFDAHSPHQAPQPYATKFRDDPYLAEIAYLDAQIGKVIETLEELELRSRTLVIVTADHGEGRGEHGEKSHSYFVYDTTMRVPLLFWGPEMLPAGKRIAAVVRSIDIAPTVLDLLGQTPLEAVQGVSLGPLLSGERTDLDLTGYGESLELHNVFGVAPLRFVREGPWKYIHKVNPEIYDLAADPSERTNLAQHESERVLRLQARLRSLLADVATPSTAAALAVDDETRAGLAALGYAPATSRAAIENEVDSLALVGDDASSKVAAVVLLTTAQGWLLAQQYERCHAAFARMLADDPQSPYLLGMTGLSLLRLERFEEALPYLEQAVEGNPDDRSFLRLLINALEHEGRTDEAAVRMRRLLELDACADVREKLYLHAQQRGDHRAQFRIFEDGARQCPESAIDLLNFAWVLATVPVEALRDGDLALATAQRGIALLEGQPRAAQIDTLAAAYAESGDFEQAVRLVREALQRLRAGGAPEPVLEPFRAHLAEFEAGRAIRDR